MSQLAHPVREAVPNVTAGLWATATALGGGLGALLAIELVPEAGFAANPTGQFGLHLLGFAAILGAGFGVAQALVLTFATHAKAPAWILLGWAPATAAGFVAMIYPLYAVDASEVANPFILATILCPGAFLLGLGQWTLLHELCDAPFNWVAWTLIGALAGAVVGAIVAVMFGAPSVLIFGGGYGGGGAVETIWAAGTGVVLGLVQGGQLLKVLRAKDQPE